jgi:MFS transporter, MHS family, shikimate and dehydroshikimate transport protein
MSHASGRDLRRVVFASVIGAAIEWYDFFLYGVVAGIVFNKLFFPAGDAFVSTLLAYATFAVGFVARPIGGVLFGHFGDRIGRKAMLVLTLLIMGVATIAIGLLPAYQEIGVAAPIMLIVLRVVQGVGLGGEWGGAVLMAYEYAPAGRRGFYASLPQIGLAIGLCLASGVVALMSYLPEAEFLSWGWRVGFLASFVLVVIALYIRLRILDTPEFAEIKAQGAQARVPFAAMLREYKMNILLGMGARFIDGVFFNVFAVFSIAYLTTNLKAPKGVALWAISLAALTMVVFIPLFGWLSDRFGRGRTYAMGALALAIIDPAP